MYLLEIITEEDCEEYKQQLEKEIPASVNGVALEGCMMVNYRYVPHSVRLEHFVDNREGDELTPFYTVWSYLVEQVEINDDLFHPATRLTGVVEIPIDVNVNLCLDDIDFLSGLLSCTEGVI